MLFGNHIYEQFLAELINQTTFLMLKSDFKLKLLTFTMLYSLHNSGLLEKVSSPDESCSDRVEPKISMVSPLGPKDMKKF